MAGRFVDAACHERYAESMSTQSLAEQALTLPLAERVHLAEALWQSIGEGLKAGDEKEAIEQAAQRDAELNSGAVSGRTHDEVMQAARRALQCD
jgi:hypothetical protein